jgi:hypothetical protein
LDNNLMPRVNATFLSCFLITAKAMRAASTCIMKQAELAAAALTTLGAATKAAAAAAAAATIADVAGICNIP